MKIVYVIVETEANYIIEQALLSIHSLRMHNPDAYVTLLIDEVSDGLIKRFNSKIREYANEIIVLELPEGLLPIQKSRFLKTISRKLVRGKMLYIDSDTIINGSLKELETLDSEVAFTSNRHGYFDNIGYHPMFKSYEKYTGFPFPYANDIKRFFNGGIFFSQDTEVAHSFFDTWHKLWWEHSTNYNYHYDQPVLCLTNLLKNNIITELDGIYNCQVIYPQQCRPYLFEAKILHYFSSSMYLSCLKVKNNDFFAKIRSHGISTEEEDYLKNFVNNYLDNYDTLKYYSKENINPQCLNKNNFFFNKNPFLSKFLTKSFDVIMKWHSKFCSREMS